jgi:SulP family sulfate permease
MSGQQPIIPGDEESAEAGTTATNSSASGNLRQLPFQRVRALSIASATGSSLPSRSYIHHAGSGSQGMAIWNRPQYRPLRLECCE